MADNEDIQVICCQQRRHVFLFLNFGTRIEAKGLVSIAPGCSRTFVPSTLLFTALSAASAIWLSRAQTQPKHIGILGSHGHACGHSQRDLPRPCADSTGVLCGGSSKCRRSSRLAGALKLLRCLTRDPRQRFPIVSRRPNGTQSIVTDTTDRRNIVTTQAEAD